MLMSTARAVAIWSLLAVAPAEATLGAFVAASDGWAVSSETAVTTGTHMPRFAPCGTASKILVTPTSLAMLTHLGDGPVRAFVQSRLEAYSTPPSPENLGELQRAAWRTMATLPAADRREHRLAARRDGRFLYVNVATVVSGVPVFTRFSLGINRDLTPMLSADVVSARPDPAEPITVEIVGDQPFFRTYVEPKAFATLMAPYRDPHVGPVDLDTAAMLSRKTIAAAIRATYEVPPTWIGGPVETATLTSAGARWVHRLPERLRGLQQAAEACRAQARN
jgi:hypothetical protein